MKIVLEALRQAHLNLKLSQCRFGVKKVEYLGFVISVKGIQPVLIKVEAIREFPRPRNVHEETIFRSCKFLPKICYFNLLFVNFAKIAAPISDLTKKDQSFDLD